MGVALHVCQPSTQEAEAREEFNVVLGSKAVWMGT